MDNTQENHYDTLVIGGGPAGTTIASLLAEKGRSVCLLEKAQHPRFHIGESLLPMNLPILEKLGVLDQVDTIGIKKYAAEFNSSETLLTQDTFYFSKATNNSPSFAYEVRRSEFDQILFRNCQQKGVTALEGMTVTHTELNSPVKKIHAKDQQGNQHEFTARYLIDASGRDTVLAQQLNSKQKNSKHKMAAIYGHFNNVERRTGKNAGNISIYWFQYGWIWLIPLKDGTTSIGCVCWPDYLKTRNTTPLDDFLQQTLKRVPEINQRMKNAQLDGTAQATGNYSYQSSIMSGEGFLLIGDAYAFVDPVFSSGVYLAMQSATRGADLVDQLLDSPDNKQLINQFESSVSEEIKAFCWFIYRFNSPALHKLLMSSDETSQHPVKQKLKSAVISVLAGDAYNNPKICLPLRAFKLLYLVNKLAEFKKNYSFERFRKQQNQA